MKKEKIPVFFGKIRKVTLTGIPEMLYCTETWLYSTDAMLKLIGTSQAGMVAIVTNDDVMVVGITEAIVKSYILGFIDANQFACLTPSRTLNLHTMN